MSERLTLAALIVGLLMVWGLFGGYVAGLVILVCLIVGLAANELDDYRREARWHRRDR